MKLSTKDTANLNTIIAVCAIGSIDAVIIDGGYIRGANPDKTCAIISDVDVPQFPQKIGLARLSQLRQRLDLFTNESNTVIDVKESDRGEISSLEISAGRSKAQFRCTSTMLIKAPTMINDEEACRIFLEKEEAQMVLNAIKVMGTKKVQLTIKKDRSVIFTLPDTTNDAFTAVLKTPSERISEDEMDSVVHYYQSDIFSSILRSKLDANPITFDVGVIGTIRTTVSGHVLVMLPQINEDAED